MIAGVQRPMLIYIKLHWLLWLPECAASHGDLCFKEAVHWLSRLGVQDRYGTGTLRVRYMHGYGFRTNLPYPIYLKMWCPKVHPLSRNPRPDRLTSLTNMSFVLFRQVFLKCDRAHHSLRCHAKRDLMPKSGLNVMCFGHLRTPVFRNFATFSRSCTFFLLTLSLPSSSFFCSSLLLAFFSSSLFMPHSVESWTLELPFTIEVAVSVQVACSSTNWGAYVGKGRKQIP